MKKLLAILVVAAMLVSIIAMTPVLSAATADIVVQSGEGTAVIDGVKDDVYDTATPLEFVQKGASNGGGEVFDTPQGYAWVINDAENVYVYFEVIDDSLTSESADTYQQDSVEVFWMNDNSKVQWRLHYTGVADADTGTAPTAEQWATVETDTGYVVEVMFPITDVLNNQLEMCLQINACTGAARDCTIYILGNQDADNAYQRSNRQTDYDVWWTLQLTGDHEDTRVDPVEEPAELTVKNYASYRDDSSVYAQLYTQNTYDWSGWASIGNGENLSLGGSITPEGWTNMFAPVASYTEEQIPEWAKMPIFAIQISDNNFLKFSTANPEVGDTGDSAKYLFTYTDITVKANGYDDVVIPGGEINTKWTVKQESGYLSGQGSTIDLIGPAATQLGLDVEGACAWLANVTDVVTTISFETIDLLSIEDINAFAEELDALEQTFVDENLKEYTDRVNAALEAANAADGDYEALSAALKEATQAANRANKEVENSGYTGVAAEHVAGLQEIVAQIQAMVDAAAPVEETVDTPEENVETNAPAENTESGSSTGLVVGIIVVIVVIVVVVVAVVFGKKKK